MATRHESELVQEWGKIVNNSQPSIPSLSKLKSIKRWVTIHPSEALILIDLYSKLFSVIKKPPPNVIYDSKIHLAKKNITWGKMKLINVFFRLYIVRENN